MAFIKLHDIDSSTEPHINTDHIICYVWNDDRNITTIQTDGGLLSIINVKETPEEIDALIEQRIK